MVEIDDDFGELYADVEVPASPSVNSMPEFRPVHIVTEENDASTAKKDNDIASPNLGSATGNERIDSACDGDRLKPGSEGSEADLKKKVVDESDSDNDLNIVLNDEGCRGFSVARNEQVIAGNGIDEEDRDNVHAEGCDLVKSQSYKCNRTHGLAITNNKKSSKSLGIASYSSKMTKGGWEAFNQVAQLGAAGNSMLAQTGYVCSLPYYRTIFNLNVDALEEKRWRVPGVDMTDFFNFGFNEQTWKEYCESVACEIRSGFGKVFEEASAEQIDQDLSGRPKGRAIQVEDSSCERQPSMDVRRPCTRDSDVVIQIKVQDTSEDCSGSSRSAHETSAVGDNATTHIRNMCNSDGEEMYTQEKDAHIPMNLSSDFNNNNQIENVVADKHQNQNVEPLKDTAEGPKSGLKPKETISSDSYDGDQLMTESELSLGDQDQLSLSSSCFDSDSEASEDSINVNPKKIPSPLRSSLAKSGTPLKEPLTLFHKTSKRKGNKREGNIYYYSRDRSSFCQNQNMRSGRLSSSPKLKKHAKYDVADVSPSLDRADLSHSDNTSIDYERQRQQDRDFGCYDRRDASYNHETENFCHFNGGKVLNDFADDTYTRYKHAYHQPNFKEYINPLKKREEHLYWQRMPRVHYENRDQNWYHSTGGRSANCKSSPLHRGRRKLSHKYSSFTFEEDSQWGRKHGGLLSKRTNYDGHWLDGNENNVTFEKHGKSTSFSVKERGFIENRYERQLTCTRRELERSGRGGRHYDSSPLHFDRKRSEEMEDAYLADMDHQIPDSQYYRQSYFEDRFNWYDMDEPHTQFDDKCRGYRRRKHDRKDGESYLCRSYNAVGIKDHIIHPVDDWGLVRRRYCGQYEVFHQNENEIMRSRDEFPMEEASFSYEKTLGHDRVQARYGSVHDNVHTCDIRLRQHYKMIREGSDDFFSRCYKLSCKSKLEKKVPTSRNSVNLVVGEGKVKSSRRCPDPRSFMSKDRVETSGRRIFKKQVPLVGFDESDEFKEIELNISEKETNLYKGKCIDRFPVKERIEDFVHLDIEEGQVVTEEPNAETLVSRDISDDGGLTHSMKKRILQNGCRSDWKNNTSNYENQQILETLAKMEKRRERFKEPIMTRKAETSAMPQVDLVVDTINSKLDRPLRKRRWGHN